VIEFPPPLAPADPARSGEEDRLWNRRSFLKLGACSIAGLALYSGEIARHEIDVVPITISLAGLPDAFDGFRIVQLSDIHLREFTEEAFLRAVVKRTNALRPDMVALTGDFISIGPLPERFGARWSYSCAQILNQLTCGLRYAVLGNHDVSVDKPAVTDALVSQSIPVLSNSAVAIERGGERIWLAGIADAYADTPNLSLALPRSRNADREPLILLAHEPDFADHALNHQVSLILSGHTHGGQVRLPFVRPRFLPPLGRRYVEGHFSFLDGTQLYVNRGIGTIGLPLRFRCPPEITVITLAQAALGHR
jgi:predicted MPP superfamily phosphohydrolase